MSFKAAADRPIVFAGPSVRALRPEARRRLDIRAPARRGDLEALRAETRPGYVLLIDGVFGASMAATPTECRHLLEDGWGLWGASSIGALRAAELWSIGMVGIGEVYLQFRLDPVPSDGDVAVAYHPDSHEELTVSVVQLRALARALAIGGFDAALVDTMFDVGSEIYWCERTWERLWDAWRSLGSDAARAMEEARAWAAVPACHPKVRDANLAVESLLTAIDDVGPSSRDIDALLTRLDHNGGTARWRNNQSS